MNDHASRRVTRRRPRSGGESRRYTRKWQQSGGGSVTFKPADMAEERSEEWDTALEDTEFASLFMTFNDVDKKSKQAAVDTFINMIAKQDDLFQKSIDIMYTKVGIDPTHVTGESLIQKLSTIETKKADLISYLKDIRAAIYFKKLSDVLTAGTKFSNLIDSVKLDPITSILLYPARVKNMFIQALATIFYQIKRNHFLFEGKHIETDEILNLLANHYEAYTISTIYETTGKPIRDSFLMDLRSSSIDIYKFYKHFIVAVYIYKQTGETLFNNNLLAPLNNTKPGTEAKAADLLKFYSPASTTVAKEGCKDFLLYGKDENESLYSFVKVAASLLIDYMNTTTKWDISSVLSKFSLTPTATSGELAAGNCGTPYINDRLTEFKTMIPDLFWDTPIYSIENGVTLRMLFSQIQREILYFMLQLIYQVNKVEEEQAPETAATGTTTTTPSSVSPPETASPATPLPTEGSTTTTPSSAPTTTSGSGE
jgi:hypothetical protein